MNTFIQVLYGLTEVLIVLQCSLKSPYANSQIYSSRNICLMASRFPHRSGLSYAPVCVPVYALGLTDWSQPIRPMLRLSLNKPHLNVFRLCLVDWISNEVYCALGVAIDARYWTSSRLFAEKLTDKRCNHTASFAAYCQDSNS